ncbi:MULTISPECIES: hypothetical protein [unclassified Bradyrhizobium]|uniref:hypothetical protein n=1 Tax=unclassified Bradyrhizobium TaxID=2631580 RepID=UPI0028E434EF|nr:MULTISPECIES: hypothetical protein [unclassified Bradyrhizobium]
MLMFLALLVAASFGGCMGCLFGAAMARGKITDLETENIMLRAHAIAVPGPSIREPGGQS